MKKLFVSSGLGANSKKDKLVNLIVFYFIACLFMAVSAYISGLVWKEANGPGEYIRLLLVEKPVIVLVTVIIFIASGVMTQVAKVTFTLSYYEISIIWLATAWVSVAILWFFNDIRPSGMELAGFMICQAGLGVVAFSKISG